MTLQDTDRVLAFFTYLVAALCLAFMGYLGWRKLHRRHHHHHHLHNRSHHHRGTWG